MRPASRRTDGRYRQAIVLAVATAMLLVLPSMSSAAGAPPDGFGRLIIRARAGLPAHKRHQLLGRHYTRVRAELPQIQMATVEASQADLAGIAAELRRSGAFVVVEEDRTVHAATVPNDPLFGEQWGTVWINSLPSWTITEGSPDFIVAILDTGVDATHPDLWGQVLSGYDFVNDDTNPHDDHGHGTVIAGIVAALTNNGIGVAGVAPRTLLLPIKVLDAAASGFYSDVAAGILAATDAGARIINLSLAGAASSETLQSAIDYARARDVVVVASAGNEGTGEPRYPAAAAGVVAVGATDVGDVRASFSNYGDWITLTAPGVSIHGPLPPSGYATAYGTSASAALTSGAFALLRAAYPNLTADETVSRMTAGAVDLGALGHDPFFGFGRIDAYAALVGSGSQPTPQTATPTGPEPTPEPTQPGPTEPDAVAPWVRIVQPAPGSLVDGIVPVDVQTGADASIQRVDLMVDRRLYATAEIPPFSFAWDTQGLSAGRHVLRAIAHDAQGNVVRSRPRRSLVTPGHGLLLRRGVLRFGRRSGNDKVVLRCLFTLPKDEPFDSLAHAVQIELSSTNSTLLSVNVPAGAMVLRRTTAKVSGLASAPTGGKTTVKVKPAQGHNLYTLKVTGRGFDFASVGTTLDLRVTVGTHVLTQSVVFRKRGDRMVSP